MSRYDVDVAQLMCCGVAELDGLSEATPAEVIHSYVNNATKNYPHVIFTQAYTKRGLRGYAFAFADYIERNALGPIAVTEVQNRNPTTQSYITVFIWTPNYRRLATWLKRNPESEQ